MSSPSCVESGCIEHSSFSCSCKKSLFLCRTHLSEHLITPGSHLPTSLVAVVPENEKDKVFNYLTFKWQNAQQRINDLLNFSNGLIKIIIDQTDKARNKLLIEQNNLISMINALHKTSMADKGILDLPISEMHNYEKSLKFDLNAASVFLNKMYSPECTKTHFKDDDFALCFRPNLCNQIDVIDLETYRKTTINLTASHLSNYCGCCKVAKNKYFLYGGHIDEGGYSNLAKIIDIQSKSIESLPSNSFTSCYGLSLFNQEVYIFGGGENRGCAINRCKKFNLNANVWIDLQRLPQENYYVTASTLSNQILVMGYQSAHMFSYNPFQNIFTAHKYNFSTNKYKYIFENWIVSFQNALFEIDENLNLIKRQEFKDSGLWLNHTGKYKRANNLYFLLGGPKLYRIKTDTKVIELINFI